MIHHQHLNLLAAIIWYCGSVALFIKSGDLLFQAHRLSDDGISHLLLGTVGILLGFLKGKLLFSAACRKNRQRIGRLTQPQLWQCYRPGFFFFLTMMILLGGILSRQASGQYWFLSAVACLDLSIAVALLSGGTAFWKPIITEQ